MNLVSAVKLVNFTSAVSAVEHGHGGGRTSDVCNPLSSLEREQTNRTRPHQILDSFTSI